jgi:hypothetical protein
VSAERRFEPASVRRLVLVVGIGRSGSSLLTGILGKLGFRVPQPEVKADDTNPRGFGEPRWVVDFHVQLMRRLRVSRFDSRPAAWKSTTEVASDEKVFGELRSWLAVQFVGTDNVVVKDPRIDWFLPLWLRCADDLGIQTSFASMLRHPSEMVRSSRESYGTWQSDASRAASWLNMTLHSERATRGARRVFIRYDDLLEDWSREISRAGALLDVPWLAGLDPSQHPEVDAFVDPDLRRSVAGWEEAAVPQALQDMLDDAWGRVSRLAEPGGDEEATRASLDEIREAYVRLYADAEAIAQSSVTAVKPRGPLQAGRSAGAKPASGSSGLRARLWSRVAKLVPRRYREHLRLAASGGWLGAGGLAVLPVRMALLIPPRYRERVPLPVVRAGLRIVRALRR